MYFCSQVKILNFTWLLNFSPPMTRIPVSACTQVWACSCSACGVPRLTSGAQWSARSWNRAEQARRAERKATRGAGGWQAAAESWNSLPVATRAAVWLTLTPPPQPPPILWSDPVHPCLPGEEGWNYRAQFGRTPVAYLRQFGFFFSPLPPFTSELHR